MDIEKIVSRLCIAILFVCSVLLIALGNLLVGGGFGVLAIIYIIEEIELERKRKRTRVRKEDDENE
jgi:hypothetical protein